MTTHNMYGTKEYRAWNAMKDRCSNPNNKYYNHYGGRGITVCYRWLRFEGFYADMGEAPKNYCLDRIDNDGNYEPTNCTWVTHAEQHRNTRHNVLDYDKAEKIRTLRIGGDTLKEISRKMGINYWTIGDVIYRNAWRKQ